MRLAMTAAKPTLEGADIIHVTDLMLEWCQLNDISLKELLSHRDIIVARFQTGVRSPAALFDDLKIKPDEQISGTLR